jgi:hypothetical protein
MSRAICRSIIGIVSRQPALAEINSLIQPEEAEDSQ